MAKIIFALKSPHFYENLPHRRSYISIDNGVVNESREKMVANQKSYLDQYFPTQEQIDSISDKANYEYVDFSIRKTNIVLKNDYPEGIYPTDFEFWSNVNYAKIIHDNGFVEYLYIKERKNKNIKANAWEFTFYIDMWNTYWIDVYQEYLRNVKETNKPLSIARLHEDRFFKVDYQKIPFYLFNFLNTQDSAFWNKESFEQEIKSSIVAATGKSYTPWEEYNVTGVDIIPNARYLIAGYGNRIFGNKIQTPFFGYNNGFLSAMVSTDKNADGKPWQILPTYNGMLNSYWLVPLTNVRDENGMIPNRFSELVEMFDNPNTSQDRFTWWGNDLNNLIVNTQTASIIQTPKPVLPFGSRLSTTSSWNDWTYPIRTRGRYSTNNNKFYSYTNNEYFWQQQTFKLGESDSKSVILTESFTFNTNSGTENFGNNPQSMLNALADERIPASDITKQLWFTTDKKKKRQAFDISLEPKLFDEEIQNITYLHYNQTSMILSPKWYFYQNWDDLLKYESMFLYGYQFVQPHLVALFQIPAGGIYTNTTYAASKVLSSFFSPNQQTATEAQAQFLVSNRSQMNTALNNQKQNSIIGGIQGGASSILSGVAGGTIAGAAGGPVGMAIGAVGGLLGGISNAIFGGIKTSNQYTQMKASQDAKLTDLANTPNATSDPVTESTFKLLNSYDGFYQVNTISEIDKYKIWTYHAENGYLLNRQRLTPSFATRIYYNFWQFPSLKMFLPNLNVINQYKEYFEVLFERGLTLWHDYWDSDLQIEQKEVGNYNYENWETNIYQELEKEVGINITVDNQNPSIVLPSQTSARINVTNYDDLVTPKITNIDRNKLNSVTWDRDVKGQIVIVPEIEILVPDSGTFQITAFNAKEPITITLSWTWSTK